MTGNSSDIASYKPRGWLLQLRHNPRLILTAFFLAMVFFTFGFDGSVIGGVLAMTPFVDRFGTLHTPLGTALTATKIGIITAIPTTGCLLGLPLAAFCGDRFGRSKTLFIGCILSAVGCALQTSAFSTAQLVIGRWIANAAIFLFIVMGSTFMAEIAPNNLRGALIGLSIVLIDAAAVVSSGINWAMSTVTTEFAWRLPTGIQIAFPVIIGVGIIFLDDYPTFYLTRSEDERALSVLKRLRRGYSDEEVNAEFGALKAQAVLRREEVEVSWLEIFKGTNLRRTLLALSIGNMQQLSGIAFATNYVTIFLKSIGSSVSPFLLVLAGAILALSGAVVGLFLVDLVGRRSLALVSFIIIFVIDLIVGVLGFTDYHNNENISRTIAGMCCLFAFFFAAGFGPLTYVISGEIPTARLRNKTSAFSFFVLACFSTVVVYVLPYISEANAANLGPKTYLIFAGWMACCTVIVYFYLPETKGRTPAELDIMFENRVPARQFKNYVCNINVESFLHQEKMGHGIKISHDEV